MAGIYCADIYCDGCIGAIKDKIATDIFNCPFKWILPNGTDISDCHRYEDVKIALESMDKRSYDDDEYPKYYDDGGESDCSNGPECARDSI